MSKWSALILAISVAGLFWFGIIAPEIRMNERYKADTGEYRNWRE